jgi:hypothetical protein
MTVLNGILRKNREGDGIDVDGRRAEKRREETSNCCEYKCRINIITSHPSQLFHLCRLV